MYNQAEATELNYNNSFPFDVIRYRQVDNYTDNQIRHIVDTVWKTLPFFTHSKKSTKKKYREMVKNYVLNLIKSYQSGYCIRVSRRTNDYHYDKRYSQIHTTSTVVIKTMDSLHDNDWIDRHIGFLDRQRNIGRQTRIFPSQKFIDLVEGTDGVGGNKKIRFIKENAKEVIQLRQKIGDNKFRLVPYKDTPKTLMMRLRLQQYNYFMRSIEALTILPLTRKELTEMNPDHRDTFNNYMLNGSIVFCDRKMRKGSKVKKETPSHPFGNGESISGGNRPTTDQSIHQEHIFFNTTSSTHTNTITTTNNHKREKEKDRKKHIPITDKVSHENQQYQSYDLNISIPYDHRENAYYSINQVLEDYPKSRKFWFRIDHCTMFRAFSDSSKAFNHHGRFYGDVIQSLPSWMRTKITMNHKEVVECDYTSIHPTMLYVMADAIPPDNIYMIDKENDPQLRKEYKTVLLVSINHKNPKTMWSAVSSHFREEFGYKKGDERLTKKYIMEIYARLLQHNKPIEKYMNTGVAMKLMRKDSEIADRIMHEFVSNDIPIRCIHDSFIVPAEYEQALKTLMVEYFQEVMKTDYVIGITTETACSNRSGKVLYGPVLNFEKEKVAEDADVEDVEGGDDDDYMKYFADVLHEDDSEDYIIIPEGHRFAGIRI